MKTARNKDEIQEVPVINPVVEIKAKVNEAIREKIDAILQDFHKQWDQGVDELIRLNQALEDLKKKQEPLLIERTTLVSGIMGYGTKGVSDLDQRINWLLKQIKGCEDQATAIFSRLTEIPNLDFPFLNFLSRYEKSKP